MAPRDAAVCGVPQVKQQKTEESDGWSHPRSVGTNPRSSLLPGETEEETSDFIEKGVSEGIPYKGNI